MDLPRPLTLLPLCFFAIGWGLFVTGFGWLLSISDNVVISPFIASSRTDASLYPFYVTLVGGPFVAVAGLLHAMVTIPILGSIMGLISAVLSVIYFVSAGTVTLLCSNNITSTIRPPDGHGGPADVKMILMLSGTVIQAVCCALC